MMPLKSTKVKSFDNSLKFNFGEMSRTIILTLGYSNMCLIFLFKKNVVVVVISNISI